MGLESVIGDLSRRKKEEERRKKEEDIHSKVLSEPYFTFN
jgi:hypothetical protein